MAPTTKGEARKAINIAEILQEAAADPPVHRRVLKFLNSAIRPEDLVLPQPQVIHIEGHTHDDHEFDRPDFEKQLRFDMDAAKQVIAFRDREFPLGFRNLLELEPLRIDLSNWRRVFELFSRRVYGHWSDFPQPIPKRGPGSITGVIHAAVLHSGQVLFITADETTLLWDPDNVTPSSFEDPVNQPHTMPGGYSQLCSHHVFLSDGQLLTVGGGGYGHNPLAHWGYRFNPVTKTWVRTSGTMAESRWYPTVVKLGDQAVTSNDHRVLVTCGHGAGDMEIYDEATDSFTLVSGDDKAFPYLYPGLHLLPNHSIFYSGTGWGTAGPGGGPFSGAKDDQSAYFVMTGPNVGIWNDIAPASPTRPDRTKGMSVLILSNAPPYARVLVVGGADPSTNNTYETIDVTGPSAAVNWSPPNPFPDGEHRSLASAVLLPDGTVFVCGGVQRTNSPCAIFNPQSNSWSAMADLPSVRDYHSVAFLLPSGQVAVAGWYSTTIEVFDPPYLHQGARPVVASAPSLVHHGQTFEIESPDAAEITRVVLVRPMAVTHQTDTEQRVLDMPYVHDHRRPTRLSLTAPHGGHPHSIAPQGYYMLFALNIRGIPSVASWIYLH